jgi:zinc/manganese transport system substrate-binding protein
MWNKLLVIFVVLFVLIGPVQAEQPLKVVASFSVVADLSREVGGDRVEVTSLVGPDADAHVYEPRPGDVRTLADADLVIVNGLGFEGWIGRLISASGYEGAVVVASTGVEPLYHHSATDPHVWQSPQRVLQYVDNIEAALRRVDPSHAEAYARRAEVYRHELLQLDGWIRERLSVVPEGHRRVVTAHDAFAYFAQDYGVAFLAPVGWSTEAAPTAATVAALTDQLRRQQVRVLFAENIKDDRQIRLLAEDAGATVGGSLYSDALSTAEGPAATYLAMIRHNVETLVEALYASLD